MKTAKASKAISRKPKVTLPLPATIVEKTIPKLRKGLFTLVSNGRNDNRKEEYTYEVQTEHRDNDDFRFLGDIPDGIQDLVLLGYEHQVPAGTPCTVFIGLYTRKAHMVINPPNTTVGRLIINLLVKDVYYLNPLANEIDIPKRDPLVEANTFFLLAPKLITNYQIVVPSNPKINSKENNVSSIRPAKYERITVIIDYHVSKEKAQEISDFANNILSSRTALNEIARKMGGKIKKPLIKPKRKPSERLLDEEDEDVYELRDEIMTKMAATRKNMDTGSSNKGKNPSGLRLDPDDYSILEAMNKARSDHDLPLLKEEEAMANIYKSSELKSSETNRSHPLTTKDDIRKKISKKHNSKSKRNSRKKKKGRRRK